MAFEIVDGMTGTKHISSDDLSALNIATIGKSDCVLDYGKNFNLTMENSNKATLDTGVGMVGGKRFWNSAVTSLTVQSGTQGQKRNDLIVARYAKTSTGVESITPLVIKGTPTTGTATDPTVTKNDLKLWRVPLKGITVDPPVRLFKPVSSLATIMDSISRRGTVKFTTHLNDNILQVTFDAPITGDYVVVITNEYVAGKEAWGWTQIDSMVYDKKTTGFMVDVYVPNQTYPVIDTVLNWVAIPV